MSIGTIFNCSKLSETIPIINPRRLKVTQVINKKNNIKIGCVISMCTNKYEVARITNPIEKDFVAAAPT